jgi:hypothetical protein|nr:MAG TPA: FeoB-associated Cys-rich membrane protein [Caudoviricetes sp.]
MNNWQQWVVIILLLLCAIRVAKGIYSFVHKTNKKVNPCDTCPTGCELKSLLDKKRAECGASQKPKKKKCCG